MFLQGFDEVSCQLRKVLRTTGLGRIETNRLAGGEGFGEPDVVAHSGQHAMRAELVTHFASDRTVLPDVVYGSRLWDAWSFRDVKNPVCRWFVHPPYVADQPTWGKIAEVLRWWLKSGRVCDDGHSDRVLCIAAQAAQVRVVGIGWSRNTVTDADAESLAAALAAGVPLIHGVKDVRYVAGWLLQQKRE